MSDVIQVNDNNFEQEVMQSKLPVLVDMSALWCGPCKRQLPIVEQLSLDYKDKIIFATVDIDECPKIVNKYKIKSVPTILFIKNGEVIFQTVGLAIGIVLNSKIQELM